MTWISDCAALTARNLIRLRREPETFIFGIIQPIMFVLLFAKVFGGAINIPGTDYASFLMAGIFAQTVVFGSTISASFIATDYKDGFTGRILTLPSRRSAYLVARTTADLFVNTVSLIVMVLTGLAVGWRTTTGVGGFLQGFALLLCFSYAFSWVMVLIGLAVKKQSAINSASFLVLFPLTFLSNAFVPSNTLPRLLQVFAEFNPVSALVQAARNAFGNTGMVPIADIWTLQHPATTVVIASIVMICIGLPVSLYLFSRRR